MIQSSPQMDPRAIFTTQDRDATLGRVLELLEADSRIEAAVLTGSLGSQRMDRWSDLDVASVIGGGESSEQVTDDWVSLVYREWPVAHHYETAFGSTLVRGFLMETSPRHRSCLHAERGPQHLGPPCG